jgi:hypothetical protein
VAAGRHSIEDHSQQRHELCDQVMKGERGSAVAAFVLVSPLVIMLCLGALQVVLAALIRTSATGVALEAARVGATWDGTAAAAVAHAHDLLDGQMSRDAVRSVTAGVVQRDGLGAMQVRIILRPMLIGPVPVTEVEAVAHVVREQQ